MYRVDTNCEIIPDYSYFSDKDNEFILVEEQDIDIQSIEEFNKEDLALYKLSTGEHLLSGDLKDKLNEVLGAIKQLDRQINNN